MITFLQLTTVNKFNEFPTVSDMNRNDILEHNLIIAGDKYNLILYFQNETAFQLVFH